MVLKPVISREGGIRHFRVIRRSSSPKLISRKGAINPAAAKRSIIADFSPR